METRVANSNEDLAAVWATLFSAQERSILSLAARDPAQSISFDKKRTKGWRALIFGVPYNYCLTNTKLETLRVTAIMLHHNDFSAEQFYRFRMAGYSRNQFDAIVAVLGHSDLADLRASAFDFERYAQAA